MEEVERSADDWSPISVRGNQWLGSNAVNMEAALTETVNLSKNAVAVRSVASA
jgi:hypothetical protein